MEIGFYLFCAAAIIIGLTIITPFCIYAVHMVAKRMKEDVHKIWPIGLVFHYPAVVAILNLQGDPKSSFEIMAWIAIPFWLIIPLILVWYRFEHWQLNADKAVFGKEADRLANER